MGKKMKIAGSRISSLFGRVKPPLAAAAQRLRNQGKYFVLRAVNKVSVLVFTTNMESFWLELCKEINVPESVAKSWGSRIKGNYSAPNRVFHNEKEMFLTHKLPFLKGVNDPALALACIFQYLEYRPMTDLCQENCNLFREFADAALSEEQAPLKSKVLRLLGAQQQVEGDLPEDDFNFFQDLDLAVLGSTHEQFMSYRNLLRREFPDMDDDSYNKMRLKVLKSFLLIPMIYCSEAFANLEFSARANIEKEIDELTK